MPNALYELETYFAQKYTKIYIEKFNGRYLNYDYPSSLIPTAMQLYFYSGRYKELNDPELNRLWERVKRRRNIMFTIVLSLIMMIFIVAVILKWLEH
jgi:hypothetical protein